MQDILSQIGGFSEIPLDGLRDLAGRGHRRTFRAGRVLMHQGEIGDRMYIIVKGRVRVERAHPLLPEPLVLARLGPGDVVGEMGLLDGNPRSATVSAIEDVETIELNATDLHETILKFPAVSGALLRMLSRRLRSTDELAAEMARRAQSPTES